MAALNGQNRGFGTELSDAMAELASSAKSLGVQLSDRQTAQLENLCRFLFEFNQHTNLVSDASPLTLIRNHILDALTLVPIVSRETSGADGKGLIDIGSGAGFPGLIVAIMVPDLAVVLVEAVGRKCRFLEECCRSLQLDGKVSVINDRAETLAHHRQYRERFYLATARAVGSLAMIAELGLPFLSLGGYLLAQKTGGQLISEEGPAESLLSNLGGVVSGRLEVEPGVARDKVILLVKKISRTPKEFPRAWPKIRSQHRL